MNQSSLNDSSHFDPIVVHPIETECELKKNNCLLRLQGFKQLLENNTLADDTKRIVRRKIEKAARFLKSNEFGACSYELDSLENLRPNR